MSVVRRVLTVHSPVPPSLLDRLLSAVEESLLKSGARRVWIDHHYLPDLIVMAELPDSETASAAATEAECSAITEAAELAVPAVPQPR